MSDEPPFGSASQKCDIVSLWHEGVTVQISLDTINPSFAPALSLSSSLLTLPELTESASTTQCSLALFLAATTDIISPEDSEFALEAEIRLRCMTRAGASALSFEVT